MTPGEAETPTTSEGVGEDVELVANDPAEGVANGAAGTSGAPAETGEPSDGTVPPELGQPVPAIAAPGFPSGSPARLLPVQFTGPITGQPVLFNVYLPPGYDSSSAAYPVLYDLHGLTDSRDTNPGPVVRSFEAAMRNGGIGPLLIVFPQSFAEGYYADSRDGARPGETQVLDELIPYVDQNFRTLAHRARRGVSGFSMGGFGALAYAAKYPDTFSVGIGYDSALDTWETLVGRRAYIAAAAFGNDESHFDGISPWANASLNAAALGNSTTLRLVPGTQYRDFNVAFSAHLMALGIPHEFSQTDCPHDYNCLIDREGPRSWAIIQAEFGKPATE
jgi:S-formylglutathione hydrolase FrmB